MGEGEVIWGFSEAWDQRLATKGTFRERLSARLGLALHHWSEEGWESTASSVLDPEDEARLREEGFSPVALKREGTWGVLRTYSTYESWLDEAGEVLFEVAHEQDKADILDLGLNVIGRHFLISMLEDGYTVRTWSAFAHPLVIDILNETLRGRSECHHGGRSPTDSLALHRHTLRRVAEERRAHPLNLASTDARHAFAAYGSRLSGSSPDSVRAHMMYKILFPLLIAAILAVVGASVAILALPAPSLTLAAGLAVAWTLITMWALQFALRRANRRRLRHYTKAPTWDEAPTPYWAKGEEETLEGLIEKTSWLGPVARTVGIPLGIMLGVLLVEWYDGATPEELIRGGLVWVSAIFLGNAVLYWLWRRHRAKNDET